MEDLIAFDKMFVSIKKHLKAGSYKLLFADLHLLKEKDKEAVTEHRFLLSHLISFLQGELSELLLTDEKMATSYLSCLEKLSEHKVRCNKSTYTKDDFFYLIVFIVETFGNIVAG